MTPTAESPAELIPLPPPIEFYTAAKNSIDRFAETEQAARAVRRQVVSPPEPPASFPDVDVLATAAIAGEALPADLGQRAWEAERGREVERLRRAWTEAIATRLEAELQTVVMHGVDSALTFLDDQLNRLLAAARNALQVAAGVHSAEDAVRAAEPQRRAFIALAELVRRLDHLRTAQRRLMIEALDFGSDGSANADRLLNYTGTVANLPAVCPLWNEAGIRGRTPDMLTGAISDASRVTPWKPVSPDRPLVPLVDLDHLTWLAEGPGVPWVATVKEAKSVTDSMLASVTPAMTDEEKRRQERLARRLDQMVAQVAQRSSYEAHVQRDYDALSSFKR